MTIDRLRGLIEPAMEEIAKGQPGAAFEQLGDEIDQLTARPSGVGFDVPAWLEALEDEVDRVRSQSDESDNALDPYPKIPQARIPLDEARRQVRDWSEDAAELGL